MPSVNGRYFQVWAPTHPNCSASGCVYGHIAVAEKALGHYLPVGAVVHHIDENGLNNANRNLVICQDHAYHMLLHLRARIVKTGGNPNTQALCSTCKQLKPRGEFNRMKSAIGVGLQKRCRGCQSEQFRIWARTKKAS